MNTSTITLSMSFLVCASSIASADLPSAHTWPMEHVMISMDNNQLVAHANTDATNPVEMQRFLGQTYTGNAAALEDQYYSDQYGWVLNGIVDPGFGNSIWIELVSQTQGLSTFEGGRRMMIGQQTFNPIFGTAGSDMGWQWSGMMTHNWYSAQELGDYAATYRVFIADDQGAQVTSIGQTTITLNFRAVPAPSSLALLGVGSLVATRRRRA